MPALDDQVGAPHGSPVYTNVRFPFPIDPPYPPDSNPVGDYRTRFAMASPMVRAVLRFEGVEGAADVWLNGEYVGSTRGSRLPSEFDVTALLRDANLLAVRVHAYSAASYVEDQDEWWAPGIIRSVSLRERPVGGVDDVHVRAGWGPHGATLRVDVATSAPDVSVSLPALEATVPVGREASVASALPWSAESPQLYDLVVQTPSERVVLRIGFRTIAIINGVFTVNGTPVKLRGVNRHEHHPQWGRHVPPDLVRSELMLMKRHHINAIRTSHYPPDPTMLAIADELGFWVVDECDLETHGFEAVGWHRNPTDDPAWETSLVDRMERMVVRDRNHPSVVMWSLGNEAGTGRNLGAMAKAARALDDTRPLHYEGDQASTHVDVWSQMYAHPDSVHRAGRREEEALEDPEADARRRAMPYVLCEFAHAMGTGPGGLREYMAAFEQHERLMGGFVWEWLEHGVEATRDGVVATLYGGDFGEPVHDGNFVIDGLVSARRMPRAQLRDLAAAYAPLVLSPASDWRSVTIRSRYDHIEAADVTLAWTAHRSSDRVGGGRLPVPPLAARGELTLDLPAEVGEAAASGNVVTLEAVQPDPADATSDIVCGVTQIVPSRAIDMPARGRLHLADIVLDRTTGALTRLGDVAITDWRLELWRAPTDNDRGRAWADGGQPSYEERWSLMGLDRLESRLLAFTSTPDGIEVHTRVGGAATDAAVDCLWTWSEGPTGLQLRLDVSPIGSWPTAWDSHWARVGIAFAISGDDREVTWAGRGPGPAYPDTGLATRVGWFSNTVRGLVEPTVRPQESGARGGVRWFAVGPAGPHAGFDVASGEDLTVTVTPWSTHDLAKHTHHHCLVPDGRTWVTIDLATAGVGTAACGPGVLPPYRLPAQRVTGTLTWGSTSPDGSTG